MSKVFLTPNLSVTKRETESGPLYELWINGRFHITYNSLSELTEAFQAIVTDRFNYELGRPKGKYEE